MFGIQKRQLRVCVSWEGRHINWTGRFGSWLGDKQDDLTTRATLGKYEGSPTNMVPLATSSPPRTPHAHPSSSNSTSSMLRFSMKVPPWIAASRENDSGNPPRP